jgi:subtilisin family serine protease
MGIARGRLCLMALCLALLLAGPPARVRGQAEADGPAIGDGGDAAAGDDGGEALERVLIRAPRPYARVVEAVRRLGGEVTREYEHLDALAAAVPRAALADIGALTGPHAITKDYLIPGPGSVDTLHGREGLPARSGEEERITFESVGALAAAEIPGFAAAHPEAYILNNALMNVHFLHAAGFGGAGVIVAVIDSGIRPGFPHISLDGSVIGGEDFVGDGRGFSHVQNNGHGTVVAGMISANALFAFNTSGAFFRAVQAYAPEATVPPNLVPMIGSAPQASIYAMRVFPPSGASPTSWILAAMDRVITLRGNYDARRPGGRNIQVVNMSLSGPTLYAGRDLFDTATDQMAKKGIVVVTSAGNAGPAGMTIGGPATSFESLAVGAASLAHNERIVRDLGFMPGAGLVLRPDEGAQTAVFSSRGPNADGRPDPEVIASGVGCYGMGFLGTNNITFANGTSFSAPTVAGVAALLRQAFPAATARQIRNAIVTSANPAFLADGSTGLDQGAGFVDALAAFNALARGTAPEALPEPPAFSKSVKENVEINAGLAVRSGPVQEHALGLKPGQRHEILHSIAPNTAAVILSVSNVVAALPPELQNQFGGDVVLLTVHSARTSRQPKDGDYNVIAFTQGGTFRVEQPETGLMRVTLTGAGSNAGRISADIAILPVKESVPSFTLQGRIGELGTVPVAVEVPAGVTEAEFRLIWREDWSNYPANDVDMVLLDPAGTLSFLGATLGNPESVLIRNPMPGTWTVFIDGFDMQTLEDRFKLRVALDGEVVR